MEEEKVIKGQPRSFTKKIKDVVEDKEHPPSTTRVESKSTLVKAEGMAMEALNALLMDPSLNTIGLPVLTSVPIHLKGIGKSFQFS